MRTAIRELLQKHVSILVLVDAALRRNRELRDILRLTVSILVLMDTALRLAHNVQETD